MIQGINLLTTEAKKEKNLSRFFLISLFLFLVTVVLAVASLMYVFFLKTTLASLSTNEKIVLLDMNKFNQQRTDLLTVSERLLVVKKIVASKKDFSQRVGLIVQSIPEGLTVNSITVEGSKVSMKIDSANLAAFNTFFSTTLLALPQQVKSGIKKIDILGFSVDQMGGYSALIDITYNSVLTE